jgi:nitrogen fixation protein FixH
MHSKKQKMMRLTSMAVTVSNILMNDFSESLSSLIIKQNTYKHGLTLNSLNKDGKAKTVNSIASNYKAIKPIGCVSLAQLKKDLRLAIK